MINPISQLNDEAKRTDGLMEKPSGKTDQSESFAKCLEKSSQEPDEEKAENSKTEKEAPQNNTEKNSEGLSAPGRMQIQTQDLTGMERFLYDLVYRDPSTWSIADRESYHVGKDGGQMNPLNAPQLEVRSNQDENSEKSLRALQSANARQSQQNDGSDSAKENERLAGQETQASSPRQKFLEDIKTSLEKIEKQEHVKENQVVKELIRTISLRKLEKGSNVNLVFNPQLLGEIALQLVVNGNHVTATFSTKSANTTKVLNTHLKALHDALIQQGLRVASLSVKQID